MLGSDFPEQQLLSLGSWQVTVDGVNVLGILRATNTLLVVACGLWVGRLLGRLDDRLRLVAGVVVFTAGYIAWALGDNAWLMIAAAVVVTLGELSRRPLSRRPGRLPGLPARRPPREAARGPAGGAARGRGPGRADGRPARFPPRPLPAKAGCLSGRRNEGAPTAAPGIDSARDSGKAVCDGSTQSRREGGLVLTHHGLRGTRRRPGGRPRGRARQGPQRR
ncbi:hypothetical protein [Streptomyces spongiicola]|uniref:hypothetical protein n=1 Tax=Streptomyces spongiicola TaxID=1690221 RepID=UPI0021D35696|nr:hypothetical protein [Streptomyces spongiicola]